MAELNLNLEKRQDTFIASVTTDTNISHEVSEEFSLPDYTPEIRRLLVVRAQVLPESKFISDSGSSSKLEFNGTVTYFVIYTDDEGKLCYLPLSSSYDATHQLISHPSCVFIDTQVDNVNCRVNGPRKLTIKSRLKSKIMAIENKMVEERIDGKSSADELYIERLSKEIKTVNIKPVSMQGIKMSDRLDIKEQGDYRPIWCDAKIVINDCKAQNNSVSVRGEAIVKCICEANNGIISLTKTLPIVEELEADGASLGDMSRVTGRCVSLAISNEQSGDNEQLFFDFICELEGEVIKNESKNVTADCYSTKCLSEEEYAELDIYSLVKAQNTSFTISETNKRKNKDIEEIVELLCDPIYEKAEVKNGKCLLCGRVNIYVIGKKETDEGSIEYLSEEYEIPFKYNVDVPSGIKDIIVRCDIGLGNVNARYDGDKFNCTLELFPTYMILEKSKAQILESSTLKKDKEVKKEASCIKVYFPKEGDTLWEIAKKYHTTLSQLQEKNDLSSTSLDQSKSLII